MGVESEAGLEISALATHFQPDSFSKASIQKARAELIGTAVKGIPVTVNGHELHFRIVSQADYHQYARISALLGKTELAYVYALRQGKPLQAVLGKAYAYETPDRFKHKGVITFLSALLFQFLISQQVKVVSGDILISNEASKKTRLQIPDLIEGGYFKVRKELLNVTDDWQYERYFSYLNKPRLVKPLTLADLDDSFTAKVKRWASYWRWCTF